MRRTLLMLASVLVLWHAVAEPVVSQVTVRQRWPWSRLVDIDYVLEGVEGGMWDIEVRAFDGTTPLDLPFASLSGDRAAVSNGPGRIVWNPTVTAYTNEQVLTQFTVELTPVQAPLYLIVDLTHAVGTPPVVQYLYEEDLASGAYGTVRDQPCARGHLAGVDRCHQRRGEQNRPSCAASGARFLYRGVRVDPGTT